MAKRNFQSSAGMKKNILITGLPGVGKTTLIMRIIEWAKEKEGIKVKGFYTREVREAGKRVGFEIMTTENQRGLLAHTKIKSPHRVSKYGVNVEGFEPLILPLLEVESSRRTLFVIDEIGKMECYSEKFIRSVRHIMDSEMPVVATLALKGGGFIAEVKRRADAEIFTLTPGKVEEVFQKIKTALNELLR